MSEHDDKLDPIAQPVVQSRRTWMRGLLLGATLLVMGGVIGSSLTVMAIQQQRDRDRFDGNRFLPRLVERLTSEMDLTGEQLSQIDAIVSSHHENLRDTHREFRNEAQAEMRAMKEGIAKVLTPEQQAYWDTRWAEMMEKMRNRRGDRDREDRDRGGRDWDDRDGDRRGDGPSRRERDDKPIEPTVSVEEPNSEQ